MNGTRNSFSPCTTSTETAESMTRRLRQEEIRRLAPTPGADLKGRPTKKSGRLIRGFNE